MLLFASGAGAGWLAWVREGVVEGLVGSCWAAAVGLNSKAGERDA